MATNDCIMLYVVPIYNGHLHLIHHHSVLRYLSYAAPSKDYAIVMELPLMVRWCNERATVGADYWGIRDLLMSSGGYYIWAVEQSTKRYYRWDNYSNLLRILMEHLHLNTQEMP